MNMAYGNEQRAWTYEEYVKKYEELQDKLKKVRKCLDAEWDEVAVETIFTDVEKLRAELEKLIKRDNVWRHKNCDLYIINGEIHAQLEKLKERCGTLIYCAALACANNNQLTGCPENKGLCGSETIHLQGCSPDADNIFGCSEFTEQATEGDK